MHIFQREISSHSDAAMFMGSSNTKSRWILHKNGGIRTHVQCHPKLYILKKKLSLSSNSQNSTFLLSKHFAINKKFQLMALIGNSLITSAVRLSVISEIDVNNGRILYAVATHVLAVAYLALVLEETGTANCSSTSACGRSSSVTTSFRLFTLCPIRSQQCSMGFISGLRLGHCSFLIPSWARDSVTTRALCGRALSSWKMGRAAWCARKCG